MKAKVRTEYRWESVTAFSGMEFVKSEYRPVPAGREQEAQAHPFLEILAESKAAVLAASKAASEAGLVITNGDEEIVVIPVEGVEQLPEFSEELKVGKAIENVTQPKPEKTAEEKAAWAAKMAKARADKKAKGG